MAVNKYVKDGYVIIESGRISGKTITLCAIINKWINTQANVGDICVIICNSFRQLSEFKAKLIVYLRDDEPVKRIDYQNLCIKVITHFDEIYYIEFCSSIENYFSDKLYGKYRGLHVSLLVGDECYINPTWCDRTACAYTQVNNVTTLSYDEIMTDEIINAAKSYMSKEQFERNIGQYL